jgi:AcrR family transcriptional regulator
MTSDDKTSEILGAAHSLFTRFGYAKTTMEDIGNTVGLNQASLYHYFRNKEDIFLNVVFSRYAQMKEAILATIKETMDLEEKLYALFKQKFTFFEQDPLLQQILDLTIKKISADAKERIQEINEEERTFLESLLQKSIDNKEIPPLDIQTTADIIIRLIEGIRIGRINKFFLEQRKRNLESMLGELQLALRYLVNGFKEK